jgi:hypothetical protein
MARFGLEQTKVIHDIRLNASKTIVECVIFERELAC